MLPHGAKVLRERIGRANLGLRDSALNSAGSQYAVRDVRRQGAAAFRQW
jgi:hypothetical protein